VKPEPLDDLPAEREDPDYPPKSNYGEGFVPKLDMKADEQRLSKSQAATLNRLGMAEFLRDLEDWAAMKLAQGYTVKPEPEEGPGIMVWRARR
jgi:hypothetical protein